MFMTLASMRAIAAGMVITVEPGIYIPEKSWRSNRRRCPDHRIRLQISERGLTRDPDEIEKIMPPRRNSAPKNPRRATIDASLSALILYIRAGMNFFPVCLESLREPCRANSSPPEFPKSANFLGSRRSPPVGMAQDNEQRQATQLRPVWSSHEGSFSPSSASITARPEQARSMQTRMRTPHRLHHRYRFALKNSWTAPSLTKSNSSTLQRRRRFSFHEYEELRADADERQELAKLSTPDSSTLVKVEFSKKKHRRGLADTMDMKVIQTEPTLQKATAAR